jgi:hypothetical protein
LFPAGTQTRASTSQYKRVSDRSNSNENVKILPGSPTWNKKQTHDFFWVSFKLPALYNDGSFMKPLMYGRTIHPKVGHNVSGGNPVRLPE